MRSCILVALLLLTSPVFAQNAPAVQAGEDKPVLIRQISMEGFVLGDSERFTKMFKPFHNKHMTGGDMNALLQQIQDIYEREGYKELVTISYQVIKHRLVFTALMTS